MVQKEHTAPAAKTYPKLSNNERAALRRAWKRRGIKPLADALGVSESAIYTWLDGAGMWSGNRKKVVAWLRDKKYLPLKPKGILPVKKVPMKRDAKSYLVEPDNPAAARFLEDLPESIQDKVADRIADKLLESL